MASGQNTNVPSGQSLWRVYLLAGGLTAVTLAVRVIIGNWLEGPTMILFTVPVILSAYWGGLGPGLLATLISTLGAAYFLLPPIGSFNVVSATHRVQVLILLFSGSLISIICSLLQRSRQRAETVILELKQKESELEAALKETLDLRQALDEHAIVAITDPAGRITFVNDKFCALSQFSRRELIGQDHRIINSGFHSKDFIRGLWTTIANGKVWHGEIKNRAKDGSYYWVDTTIVPFLNADGKPRQYVAIRADITERKQAAESLKESEERFRTMANSMSQLAWIARADGFIFWYNRRWYEYTGTTPEQMEGWGWQSVHDPVVLPSVMENWTAAIAAGEPFEMEFPLRAADGQFRRFLTRSLPLKDSTGRVVQWFGTNTDVDVLKQAETTIRESEERFRFLHDLSEATRSLADPEQIMAVTSRMLGEHLLVSRCAYADVEKDGEKFAIWYDYTDGCASTVGDYQLSLFGARAVAELQQGITLIVSDVDREFSPGDGADMFNAIGIKAIIACPLVKDGVLRAIMSIHQTRPRAWQREEITLVQDVVERCWATIKRRAAEEQVHRLNAELEQRVALRTAELKAANDELEAFSYSISHDLRAPVRAMGGFANVLEKDFGGQLPEGGHFAIQRIKVNAAHMGQLIDGLLEFASLSRQPLQKKTLNPTAIARKVLDELMAELSDRRVDAEIAELPECQADRLLLNQVFTNLLSNAIKYTRGRDPAVIRVGWRKEGEETVYFVQDNGAGFDMRYAGKLFQVFQRLHGMKDFEGTGVGLANVHRIISRHGGRIWAEAKVGEGATFYFTLGKS